jgi:hypothetical protein
MIRKPARFDLRLLVVSGRLIAGVFMRLFRLVQEQNQNG